MHELLRRARVLRCDAADPGQAFRHRLRIGVIIAVLIFLVATLG